VVSGPSKTWVFIEPNQDSHWGPTFDHYISQNVEWGHMPTDRHSMGCQLSFADGHVPSMRWKAPKEVRPFRDTNLIQAGDDRDDYNRLLGGLPGFCLV
jgi:prepilin-type processing-associated H-X9-DG protein